MCNRRVLAVVPANTRSAGIDVKPSEVKAAVHQHVLVHLLIEFSRFAGREAAGRVLINAEQQIWNEAGWQRMGRANAKGKAETIAYFSEIVSLLNRATLYGATD